MDEICDSLLVAQPTSDLIALVELQRLAETLILFHRSKDLESNEPITAQMNIQTFQNGLHVWRAKTLDEIRTLRMLPSSMSVLHL